MSYCQRRVIIFLRGDNWCYLCKYFVLDFFIHWLETKYEKTNPPADYDRYTEISNFEVYVSKKISYLKRPAVTKKRTKVYVDVKKGTNNFFSHSLSVLACKK